MITHSPETTHSKQQRILQQTLWFALISTALLLVVAAIHYSLYLSSQRLQLEQDELLNLELGKTTIKTELSNIQSDVNFLARQAEMHRYVDELGPTNLDIMAHDFQLFAQQRHIYDQIRLLNIDGQEIIRINYHDGQAVIVDQADLQSKADRYYFRESLQLERNEIYISPFDLNVEHGQVQIPLKPVIRFGTPVFNSRDEKVGVLMLNYLGNRLLDSFRSATSNIASHIMLINSDGYWLSHPDRDLEWGFMLDQERNFATDHPEEWKIIAGSEAGQMENDNGLFTYTTVNPGLEIAGYSGGTAQGHARPEFFNRPWKLVALVTPLELAAIPQRFLQDNLLFYVVMLLIFLVGSHVIARLNVQHQLAEIRVEFEQYFRKVLESIELYVLAVDTDGRITFCNDALVHLLGWSREELIGKNWVDTLVVSRHRERCRRHFREIIEQDDKSGQHESWLQDRRGREYLVRWHNTLLSDADDRDIGLIFMGEDITAHRENEIKVRQLSQAVEQSPASVILTNDQGQIEYVNPKFEQLTGYSLEEIKGLNPRVLKSGETSPEDYSRLWNTIKRGGTWRGIFHNRKKNGELYWESASISGIRNPEGEITHFLAVKEDITRQKLLEERFRHCFNAAPVAMVMTDERNRILLANDKLQQLYGYSEEELLGEDIERLAPPDALQPPADNGTLPAPHRDFLATRGNGEVFPVEIGVSTTPTLEGEMRIAAIIDLTARHQLEQELLARNEEISRNQALNTVGRMANMIAHDLRNPLSSIKMGLQIFQKQSINMSAESATELNQIALEQVHYMEEILADLMNYSRPDALNLEWVDVEKLIDHSISVVQKEIDQAGAEISSWYEKGLPIVSADTRKLRQALSNLLTNAIQSVESLEGVRPVIRVTALLELGDENACIRITISDNGAGIDEDNVEQLFEPFHTTRSKGTGLGLAIARRFIELQHGRLTLHANEKGGCDAVVRLNIDPAQ